jgi:hypothetical protein
VRAGKGNFSGISSTGTQQEAYQAGSEKHVGIIDENHWVDSGNARGLDLRGVGVAGEVYIRRNASEKKKRTISKAIIATIAISR